MTYYEVFQKATREEMAKLLTALTCGALGGDVEPEEKAEIHKTILAFLGQEAECGSGC